MHMALETRPWTRADLDRLPDDGNTYEVLDGELLVTPPPSAQHQDVVAWLAEQLFPFVKANDLGKLHFPRSVVVIDGSQVEPDLFVRADSVAPEWENKPRPILVIEVLSQSTRRRDLKQKRDFYMEKGIPEYWAVDRDARAIIRFTPGSSETVTRVLRSAPGASRGALDIDVVALFAEAGRREPRS